MDKPEPMPLLCLSSGTGLLLVPGGSLRLFPPKRNLNSRMNSIVAS